MVEAFFVYPHGRNERILFYTRLEAEQYFKKENVPTMFLIGKYEDDEGGQIEIHWLYRSEYEVMASDPESNIDDGYFLYTTSDLSEANKKFMEYNLLKSKMGGTKSIVIYKTITCYREAEELERTSWNLIA